MKVFSFFVGFLLSVGFLFSLASCSGKDYEGQMVEIVTPFGSMKAVLFDDTPLHKENFVRLAAQHKYDSLLFHRVLRGYLIQGGDPQSRDAAPGVKLGGGSIGHGVDAEIRFPHHFHCRGALCAARATDDVNPEKRSSGSQFYIVDGSPLSDAKLDEFATIHDNKKRRRIYQELMPFYQDSLQQLQDAGDAQALSQLQFRMIQRVEELLCQAGKFQYTDSMRQTYRTVGGLPELDGDYTVFGQVVDGLEVIDSICKYSVALPSMRPHKDIRMAVRLLN